MVRREKICINNPTVNQNNICASKMCTNSCITENFNMNISHQLFDYMITFVNSQPYSTRLKVDFLLKNWF